MIVSHDRWSGVPGPRPRLRSIAGPWLIAVALFAAQIVNGVVSAAGDGLIDLPTFAFNAITASWGLVLATVGALIALRRPENRIGRLLQVSGPLVVAVFLGYELAVVRMTTFGPGDPVGGIAGWWASTTFFLAIYLAFPLVGILYPDGRLPGRRWRLPILILTLAEIASSAVFAVAAGSIGPGLPDNPFGVVVVSTAIRDTAGLVGALALAAAMALAVVAISVRWRRGNRVERSQLKWLFAAILVAAVLFAVTFGGGSSDDSPDLLTDFGVASALLIPLAIGIAILRYRLYEIDRLISRTLTWAFVTVVLAVVFVGVVVALEAALSGVTQGETLAVAASTLAALALFQPVRRRIQLLVDRRFDRARYDGERTTAAFAERLRGQVDLQTISVHLVTAVDAAVRPTGTSVWLRGSGR